MSVVQFGFIVIGVLVIVFGINVAFTTTKNIIKRVYVLSVCSLIGAGFFMLSYIAHQEYITYENAEVIKIHDLRITDADSRYIEFVYWENDQKIQRAEVDLEDVRIGDKSALALKEKADYILDLNGYNDSRIQYLQLTEEDFDKVYQSIN